MTTYNKLKIAILTIIASQNIHAINIDPVNIQTGVGELLYAELSFRQSDMSKQIEVSLANSEDLISIRERHLPPSDLNFFTRRNNDGTGVITITSSRPITASELNFIVKIKEGSTTRLQQIKKPLTRNSNSSANQARANNKENSLTPIMIVNEQDIALNLPTSSTFQTTATNPTISSNEKPLDIKKFAPPQLSSGVVVQSAVPANIQNVQPQPAIAQEKPTKAVETPTTKIAQTEPPKTQKVTSNTSDQIAPLMAQNTVSADPLVKKYNESLKTKQNEPKSTTQENKAPAASQPKNDQHVVKNNESLWTIAAKVAEQENRSVSEVMQQIKANNQHAFIKGDVNRLRRGSTLNLQAQNNQKDREKVKAAQPNSTTPHHAGKAKYRLNQAEMSLVTENNKNSAHGSASKSENKHKTSDDLSSKVMTSREKTVKLQKDVTQLEVALNQKDHRIQLLNARLAQLQQQLEKQQAAKKTNN